VTDATREKSEAYEQYEAASPINYQGTSSEKEMCDFLVKHLVASEKRNRSAREGLLLLSCCQIG
jgi:hypothetical protein